MYIRKLKQVKKLFDYLLSLKPEEQNINYAKLKVAANEFPTETVKDFVFDYDQEWIR